MKALKSILFICFLILTSVLRGQTFTLQTGASNPMNGVDIGVRSSPAFVDIDNDGDIDLFSGENDGVINYYENTGTTASATYTVRTGANNPFNGIDVGSKSFIRFVDIDADGDLDAFIGERAGNFNFFRNTGTAASPTFTAVTGASNPLNGFIVTGPGAEENATPSFADLDNDGDIDCMSGEGNGLYHYYRNTGTAAAAVFTEQIGANNPLNGFDIGQGSVPQFIDLDSDGDWDIISGAFDGTVAYYRNTGTVAAPSYSNITGASNPFNGVDVGNAAAPTFADIDDDGDADAFIGELNGNFNFYDGDGTGSTPLPIELLDFTASCIESNNVLIEWTTASELNNDYFTIERSINGKIYEHLAIVPSIGNSIVLQEYSIFDNSYRLDKATVYYKLKQTDIDGTETEFSAVKVRSCDLFENIEIGLLPMGNREYRVNDSRVESVSIYNINGQLILQKDLGDNKNFSLLEMPTAVYLVRLTGNAFEPKVMKLPVIDN